MEGSKSVLADFASRPPSNGVSTFDELRKDMDEHAVNAVLRVDLRHLIEEHADEEFVNNDNRIKQDRLKRHDGVFWYTPNGGDPDSARATKNSHH